MLEGTDVVKSNQGVPINVDSRRIDVRAKQLWEAGGARTIGFRAALFK